MIPLLLLAACTGSSPTVTPDPNRSATPPVAATPTAVALARDARHLTLDLPPSTRPEAEVPASFSPRGRARKKETRDDVTIWALPLPVHSNLFPSKQAGARSFGNWNPEGLSVTHAGKRLGFKRHAHGRHTYGYDRAFLLIGLPSEAPAPHPDDLVLTWPKATDAERALHLQTAGVAPEAFALRTVTVDTASHTGVLVPAPGSATWRLTVPPKAHLSLRGTILPPAIANDRTSDGARVVVEVLQGESVRGLGSYPVQVDAWADISVDLSAFAGKTIGLRLSSDPMAHAYNDLVFLEEPTVHTPRKTPKRIVMAFLDTVRADHLGAYGYSRDTTPHIDAWAAGALRLDAQRTVAPWTLPSARATLTGAQPELFATTETLPERLARAGFLTDGIVANAYLSQTFDMHKGFGRYRYHHLLPATRLVDHAIDVLERNPERDVFLWVQFMDAHLPYMEPDSYRGLWAGPKPAGLGSVARAELVKWGPRRADFDAVRQHVIDRYDQNIRYLDDQVHRLIQAAGPDATVILFADHGEEFWDHGGYEHGHAFHDELMRVPTLIYDPHLPPGVITAPTNLLDLTPTVLELAGLPASTPHGRSLVPAAFGDDGAVAELQRRPQGFGRPLYDEDGWGVVTGGMKWWSRGGTETAYDLGADPGETKPVAAPAEPAADLANALGRDVPMVWRVALVPGRSRSGATLTVRHPGGVVAAWKSYDPRSLHDDVTATVAEGVATFTAPQGSRLPDAVYVQVGDPAARDGFTATVTGADRADVTLSAEGAAALADGELVVAAENDSMWKLRVDRAWVPVPAGDEVSAYHPDMRSQLEELGYLDEDPDEEPGSAD